jgi:acyl-coenzyme A synthetase/AMP-(fatty) acid ligase
LPGAVILQDRLEPIAGGFRLLGRASDLLKVGGRRASLADLTQKLLSIPGVLDGVMFQPQRADSDGIVERPAALVVAPDLSEGDIMAALSRLIDPIFMPRPLRLLASLPRNAVGKLPQSALDQLLTEA